MLGWRNEVTGEGEAEMASISGTLFKAIERVEAVREGSTGGVLVLRVDWRVWRAVFKGAMSSIGFLCG